MHSTKRVYGRVILLFPHGASTFLRHSPTPVVRRYHFERRGRLAVEKGFCQAMACRLQGRVAFLLTA